MATIDATIYVARPDLISLDDDECDFRNLIDALDEEAAGATSVTIFGGYMSIKHIVGLCSKIPRRGNGGRSGFPLRVGIGIDPSRPLAQQWDDLRELSQRLRALGFHKSEVKAIFDGSVHFHTKLYGFMRTTSPSWYIGSANPTGSARHEMMVRVGRKHEALTAYADQAFAKGTDVDRLAPVENPAKLQAFLRVGFLAYRPPAARFFTFDAFRFTASDRATLSQGAAARIALRHASPKTEGFGFNLTAALSVPSIDDAAGTAVHKVRLREASVETIYGFWIPRPYAMALKAAFDQEQRAREERLLKFVKALDGKGRQTARREYTNYLSDMSEFLRARKIERKPIADHGVVFERFLDTREHLLGDPARRSKAARVMVLAPMPDVWGDSDQATNFEDSFFSDISDRAMAVRFGARVGRVIRSIMKGVGEADLAVPDAIRDALKKRLAERPWADAEWLGRRG